MGGIGGDLHVCICSDMPNASLSRVSRVPCHSWYCCPGDPAICDPAAACGRRQTADGADGRRQTADAHMPRDRRAVCCLLRIEIETAPPVCPVRPVARRACACWHAGARRRPAPASLLRCVRWLLASDSNTTRSANHPRLRDARRGSPGPAGWRHDEAVRGQSVSVNCRSSRSSRPTRSLPAWPRWPRCDTMHA